MLKCEGIHKRFGGLEALRQVTFAFDRSLVYAIIGPNGAGKSTLVNVISGFLDADAGQCRFERKVISGLRPELIVRLGIARTFQEVRVAKSLTVLESVLVALPVKGLELISDTLGYRLAQRERFRARAREILASFNIEDWSDKSCFSLSFGQKKLLAVICCVATDARVLLLDEPVAGLDPLASERIGQLMVNVARQGRTVIFIEHELSVVREKADRVLVMANGSIVAEGEPEKVLEREDVLRAYIG